MFTFVLRSLFVKNCEAQFLGYGFGVLTERPIDPIKLLPPIISYSAPVYDFIAEVTGATRTERIATIAFLMSGTGILARTGDPVVNAGAGSFIYLLAQYISSVTSGSGGGGPIPFIYARPNRKLRRFTTKQHVQCQLAIAGILIIAAGGSYIIVLIAKKVRKFCKANAKAYLKKVKNALTKSSKIKVKAVVKFFKPKSKPRVRIIQLA